MTHIAPGSPKATSPIFTIFFSDILYLFQA